MSYDKNHAKFILDSAVGQLATLGVPEDAKHFIGLSGGKDSTACAAVAEYAGLQYDAFVCDTDHEKPVTVEYLAELRRALSCEVQVLQRQTTEAEFEERRNFIRGAWSKWATPALRSRAKKAMGVRQMVPPLTPDQIEAVCASLKPSGNAFLDRLLIHGTMPQKTGKYCSLELKTELAWEQVIKNFLDTDHKGEEVLWWSGVREQESVARQGLKVFEPCGLDATGYVYNFRPVYSLTHSEVFQVAKYMGLPFNPAYAQGDRRVGCNECFEANKAAIRNTFTRDPSALARIDRWEREVAKVCRYAIQNGKTYVPFFREAYRLKQYGCWASVEQIFEWSKTDRRGREVEVVAPACDSVYGLCG